MKDMVFDFVIFSLGCKVNQTEGQSLGKTLQDKGYSVSLELEPAKFYILNACSVTGEAARKSRQCISRIKKLNNDAKIFLIGCIENGGDFLKNDVYYIGSAVKKAEALEEILSIVNNAEYATTVVYGDYIFPKEFDTMAIPLKSRTRAYIKVQDGCNEFCSYCIVPSLRGRSRSRNIDSIIFEARMQAKESDELVLTGINLADFKIDGRPALSELIRAFRYVNAKRKRIGSLGINIISDELLSAFKDAGFCDHFHLSVQSGSDTVLERMGRRYTARDILDKVELIRRFYPNSGIMCDIICGFPGETDKEFDETVALCKKVKFADAHIFPYSVRTGTKAANMEQVDITIRKKRAAELNRICDTYKTEFLSSQLNLQNEVYIEENGCGYTTNYCKVYTDLPKNQIVKITPTKLYKDGLC